MNEPDFIPMPDPPERLDPHERGVRLIYILIVICGLVLAYAVYRNGAAGL
jgi:hypothetical protein